MYVLGSDQKNEMKILHHSFMASALVQNAPSLLLSLQDFPPLISCLSPRGSDAWFIPPVLLLNVVLV